ncbi:MAG: DNA alkylation repair protein [Acutalibacter sp.]
MNSLTPASREELVRELESLADPAYKEFNDKLLPGVDTAYGIRLPQLRQLSKRILRGAPQEYLDHLPPRTFEETMLRGMIIAGLKVPWEEKRAYVEEFLPRIDNWAVCDTFCGGLSPRSQEDAEKIWQFLLPFYPSDREYFARFAAVMQLAHFVDSSHLEEGLGLLEQTRHPGYYAKMGVAWALSVWYVKFPSETKALLERRVLDPWVQNKAIQKVRESLRVSREEKDALTDLKL